MGHPVPDANSPSGYSDSDSGAPFFDANDPRNPANQAAKANAARNSMAGLDANTMARNAPDLNWRASAQGEIAQQQNRGVQLAQLGMLGQTAAGHGPSVAATQQQLGMGNSLNAALAGGAGRAGAPAMAAGQAGMGQALQQGVAGRSNEMAQALTNFGQGAGALSSSDAAYRQNEQQQMQRAMALQYQQQQQNQGYVQGREQDLFNLKAQEAKYSQQKYQQQQSQGIQTAAQNQQAAAEAASAAASIASMIAAGSAAAA